MRKETSRAMALLCGCIVIALAVSTRSGSANVGAKFLENIHMSVVNVQARGFRSGSIGKGGTGVVVGPNEVLTNCHVTGSKRDKAEITVLQDTDVRATEEPYPLKATLVYEELLRDLCLLYVEDLSTPPAGIPVKFDSRGSRALPLREDVIAAGYPGALEKGIVVSTGVVNQLPQCFYDVPCAFGPEDTDVCGENGERLIVTDALVAGGSSGGALFSETSGALLGITTRRCSYDDKGFPVHFALAMPVEWAIELVEDAQRSLDDTKKSRAEKHAYNGLFDAAVVVARQIQSTTVRARALMNIAKLIALSGQIELSWQVFDAAVDDIQNIDAELSGSRRSAWTRLARRLAEVSAGLRDDEFLQAALRIRDEVEQPEHKQRILREIAKVETWRRIIKELANIGDFQAALAAVENVKTVFGKISRLVHIGVRQSAAGLVDDAKQTFQTAITLADTLLSEQSNRYWRAVGRIAEGYSDAQLHHEALDLARGIEDVSERARVFWHLLRKTIISPGIDQPSELCDQARETSRQMGNGTTRGQRLLSEIEDVCD